MLRVFFRPVYLLIATLVVGLACLLGVLGYHHFTFQGKVFPGVRLQGVDLSGMSPEEVFFVAQAQGKYFVSPSITLRADARIFTYRPADFGVGLDPAETTRRALSIGREGDMQAQVRQRFESWWRGVDISPVVRLDDAEAAHVIDQVASATERAAQNAQVVFENGAVIETAAQTGLSLDRATALRMVNAAIVSNQFAEITLPYKSVAPDVNSASTAATELSNLFSGDLVVQVPQWDAQGNAQPAVESFRIRAADLPEFVIVENAPAENGIAKVNVRMRREKLRGLIEPLMSAVTQSPQNARFVYDTAAKKLINLSPSREGRALNIESTLNAVEAALRTRDQRTVTLSVDVTQAPVPASATAQDLGITQLITQATTFFRGSGAPRIANIKTAAARFHGVVVPPGQTFSFNQFLGDVSEADGFEVGLVIVGNRTVKGVGGGVCQVSTTAYQAALRAGFPIVERYPHGYRVKYYENGMGAGFDAAVFTPYADFKFVNDTQSHLLIETYFDPARVTLTFKFYGTPDGREVAISQSVVSDPVPHGPDVYEQDTDNEVAPGKAKQVDYAVDGATVAFTRVVTRGGQTLINEKVTSKYVPWQNVFRFGQGFTPPEGAVIIGPDGKPIETPIAPTPISD
jgi:vancomycin resistance protein YoaR